MFEGIGILGLNWTSLLVLSLIRDTGSPENKSEKSTLTGMSVLSHASGGASPLTTSKPHVSRFDPEAFFSIQLEKVR